MFDLTKIPDCIVNKLENSAWTFDDLGMSGSTILLFDKIVLKIERQSLSSKTETELLLWLEGRLPVPKVIQAVQQDGYSFILMSRLPCEPACSDRNLQNMDHTVKALAKALKMLWNIYPVDCPFSNSLSDKLIQGKYNIENGLVDINNLEEETLSPGGFSDLWDLYNYLMKNQPILDPVFSHGDFCLPNIFISGEDVIGFVDWGRGGIADRWQDIALCVRSLRHNCIEFGKYSEMEYERYKRLLFDCLQIEPDEDKIRYYCLLDELF